MIDGWANKLYSFNKETVVAENQDLTIICEPGTLISVTFGKYGKGDSCTAASAMSGMV